MSDDKTFDLIVEGRSENGVTSRALELVKLVWNGDSPPDVVMLEGGIILVKVGRYLSAGDRYRYNVATVGRMVGGQLTGDSAMESLRQVESENKVWLDRHADLLEINGYHEAAIFLSGAASTFTYIPDNLLTDLTETRDGKS